MGFGLGFALKGAGEGMDERRTKDIQDAEIQHTKERRAIVEPLQDQALGLQVQNAADEAQYRKEDRPLERTSKEQAVATGGLQLDAAKQTLPLDIEAKKTQNKLLSLNADLAQLHLGEYQKESAIKSMDLRGQRAYGIAKLADINPTLALQEFNNMPETKASGTQAAWIGYTTNPNDPKDNEKYLVAKDANGNIINFKAPGGKEVPAMYKKSALDIYAPKFAQYKENTQTGGIYSDLTGQPPPGSGPSRVPIKVSNDIGRAVRAYWGNTSFNGISFDGENKDSATQHAALAEKLMQDNPNLPMNAAIQQAYQQVKSQNQRNAAMGNVSGAPSGSSGNQTDYSNLWMPPAAPANPVQ